MRRFILSLALSAMTLSLNAADPVVRETLTSADRGIHLDEWQISDRDVSLNTTARWSVRKRTLHGGKQEGVDIIEVDNGKLRFTVIPTRGMSVLRVDAGDVRLGWDSPVKEVVHPQFVNLESRGGLGWLEGFNEWMVRCGLEFAGHPGKDKFINNVGDQAEMDLTLHGKIGNIPASEVEVLIDREPSPRIRVRGRVDENMFYGPKLELWTEISTAPGSQEFRISDSITNHGDYDQECQIIYHANFGPPLLEKNARFIGAVRRVVPFNAHAAKGIQNYAEYAEPTKGFIEQVYCLYPAADENKQTMIMLQNQAGNRAVSMRFSTDELPYVTLWKNTNSRAEGYVTGLEPGTGFPYNRRIERHFGRVPKIGPGQQRSFTIDFAIHTESNGVRAAAEQIRRIQGSVKPEIVSEPVKLPE